MKQYDHLVWTPEMVKNYWDYMSRNPEEYFTYQHGASVVHQITSFLKKNGDVLDFGCGPGYLLEKLLAAGFNAAGLDASDESRQMVEKRFIDQREFLGVYNQSELLGADLRFDSITAIEVIEHLYDDQLEESLELIRKLVKPEGKVIFTTPNEENLEESYILCPATNQLFHKWQHVRSWSSDTLSDYLEQRGFEVVNCFTTNFAISFYGGLGKPFLKGKWRALRSKIKQRIKPRERQPHLVVIARQK